MLKSLSTLIAFIVLICFCIPINGLGGEAVVVLSGKSGGEFISKQQLTADKVFSLDGSSFNLSSDSDIRLLVEKLNAKITHYFYDGEVENYYFFTEKLPKIEVIAGKKVNLHVAKSKGDITVGSPIIYYGY